MYIAYDVKKGVEYAKLCTSRRDGKTIKQGSVYLGRVLDKEKGIYKSRERGVFTYNLETDSYGAPPASYVPPERPSPKERFILDFGDAFLLKSFLRDSGLEPVIDAIEYHNMDTLYAMVYFYMLCHRTNDIAEGWWEGNYARILFPDADLSSKGIDDLLAAIGDEDVQEDFFGKYIPCVGEGRGNVLIDSTGMPNSVHFPLTMVVDDNGDAFNEVRLVYVMQRESCLPVFFRHFRGDAIDTSGLIRAISELKDGGLEMEFTVLDADYYSKESLSALFDSGIPFISRLWEDMRLYKELVEKHVPVKEDLENFIRYNDRYFYLKRVECALIPGQRAYAFVGLDLERKMDEISELLEWAKADALTTAEVHEQLTHQGIFILVSSTQMEKDEILAACFTRLQARQVFDMEKNNGGFTRLVVKSEDALRGHLLLTFIATAISKKIEEKSGDSEFDLDGLFMSMRNQKCKVYDRHIVIQKAYEDASDGYKLFGVECPKEILVKMSN